MSEIDLSKEKVLFRCHHVDELTAYKMIRNKEKITPDNVPICDLEMALIAYPESPYGFTVISKDNKEEWEYMGFGHSGACSIVAALLKEIQAQKKECLTIINKNNRLEEKKNTLELLLEGKNNQYNAATQECEKLKEELQNVQHNCTREGCRYYEDNTYKVFYKCKAKTEADKMEQKIKQVKSFVADLMFDVDCINWFERFVVAFEDWKTQLGNDRDRYKQALDEIETLLQDALDTEKTDTQESFDNFYKCLDIIAKAKEQ